MDQGPLVETQIDAGMKFVDLLRKEWEVTAAFWLKKSDSGRWHLYIVTPIVDGVDPRPAYRDVARVARAMPEPRLDSFQVKLIGTQSPLASEVSKLERWYPARIPTRYHGQVIGGVSVEEAYLYPRQDASAPVGS